METTSACVCVRHLTFDLDDQTDDRSLCRYDQNHLVLTGMMLLPPGSVQQKKLKLLLLLNNLFPANAQPGNGF